MLLLLSFVETRNNLHKIFSFRALRRWFLRDHIFLLGVAVAARKHVRAIFLNALEHHFYGSRGHCGGGGRRRARCYGCGRGRRSR